MAALPILTIPGAIIQGDSWSGFALTITQDGTPINLMDVNIRLDMLSTSGDNMKFSTSPEQEEYRITITDYTGGKFQLDSVKSFAPDLGDYSGTLVMTFTDGTITSYCIVKMSINKQ